MEQIEKLNEILNTIGDIKEALNEVNFDNFTLNSHHKFSLERVNMLTGHIKDTIAIATEQINSQEEGK